ncbi:DeoR family transcriptional regulator [Georgenia soli]|uniref:Lactose phosphotransferase system repressor n=1 Tax=Georgenia soli TaxID=638953 RepID=A0A2A9F354_9MICO|nr:DeoR/GlpR family DNA-binding transcription regulator [Georgenia soli]PFG44940.1 DeoR family transcriptional regulator [Georgenia soli]
MLAASRRSRILEIVRDQESVQTEELVDVLGVSVETVRRDLEHLERAGSLLRVRGGALKTPATPGTEPPFDARVTLASKEKEQVAKAAARLMESTRTVFIDIGTTAAAVARSIGPEFTGTVVTPSVRIAEMLAGISGATVLLPGGQLRPGDLAISGPTARQFLADIYPDVAFIGTGGVDVDAGLTDFELVEVEIKRVMIANSRRSYALADSSKLGSRAPYRVCDLTELDGVISDRQVSQRLRNAFSDRDINLVIA